MYEAFLVLYSTLFFHLVWNIQQRSRKRGIDMLSGAYVVLVVILGYLWAVLVKWEQRHNIAGLFFVLITSAVFFLLSRKAVERLVDRFNL